jgi:hypothetical protein
MLIRVCDRGEIALKICLPNKPSWRLKQKVAFFSFHDESTLRLTVFYKTTAMINLSPSFPGGKVHNQPKTISKTGFRVS